MILKASAANGSVSSGARSTCASSSFGRWPSTGGTSAGDGRYATIASRSGCTPLFLKADPHITGTPSPAIVARRIARCISSIVGSSSCTNFSIRDSS